MNWKKFFISLLVIYAVYELSGYLIHMIFLNGEYASESLKTILRPKAQLASNMWLIWITDLIWCFFFILIYLKGFRKKGIIDGLKYGVYIGIFVGFVNSFKTYALSPFPYIVIFYWFFFFMLQSVLLGLLIWFLYRKEPVSQ
ncbi:MAG: hypothetical protein C0412_03995 [Flavobacterium sp.]|nr:hypothetical protein [Flavobacterium sp.]